MSRKIIMPLFIGLLLGFSLLAATKLVHRIDQKKCNQCGDCVSVCKDDAIKVVKKDGKKIHIIDTKKCTQCGLCIGICENHAIVIDTVGQAVTPVSSEKNTDKATPKTK